MSSIVYFSHSYRAVDAHFVGFFADLLRSEGFLISLDPPSGAVNASKLQRHLRTSDAMVAVLSWREPAVSQHILFEISMCLQARKPLLVFIEDMLLDGLVPARIFHRRFSRRSYLRQFREHRHSVQILKTFLGEEASPRYQPTPSRRSCVVTGFDVVAPAIRESIKSVVSDSGYAVADFDESELLPIHNARLFEALDCADFAVACVDTADRHANFVAGAITGSAVPTIALTLNSSYPFHKAIPLEYQPRVIDRDATGETVAARLKNELRLYEEDFLDLEDQSEVARYREQLISMAATGSYSHATRGRIVQEVVMGDQYHIEGPSVAVGRGAMAVDNEVLQLWHRAGEGRIDLAALGDELDQLRSALKAEAATPEQDLAVAEVAAAELAARGNDGQLAFHHLKRAGSWALDTANKIGIGVATAALKAVLGF